MRVAIDSDNNLRRTGQQNGGRGVKVRQTASRSEFEALVLPHLDNLYRTALQMAHRPDEAEDLVQETLMRAFRSFATFAPKTNFRAWLLKILTNSYINRYRKHKDNPARTSLEDVRAFLTSDEAEEPSRELANRPAPIMDECFDQEVRHALDGLPKKFRQVVVMALVEGMSHKEIAAAMNCPLRTVMSRLYRSRQRLRRRLASYVRQSGYRGNAGEDNSSRSHLIAGPVAPAEIAPCLGHFALPPGK